MYLMLTERCNMRCKHCCYACTEKGRDMSEKVFNAALELCGGSIALGGGEPTLHPKFEKFLMKALSTGADVWLATNGSNECLTLALAELGRKGVLGVTLSLDAYHDRTMVSNRVISAFKKVTDATASVYSQLNIRDVTGREIRAGRWKLPSSKLVRSECPCPDLFVKPNGDIMHCGCHNSLKYGNILHSKNLTLDSYWENPYECWKIELRNRKKRTT